MKAQYTCRLCGLTKQEFDAPERARAVDVKLYLDTVMRRAQADHSLRRPACRTRHLDLMLPIDKRGTVGKTEGQ